MQILYIIPLSSKYILLTIFKTFMAEGVIAYVNTYKSGLESFQVVTLPGVISSAC